MCATTIDLPVQTLTPRGLRAQIDYRDSVARDLQAFDSDRFDDEVRRRWPLRLRRRFHYSGLEAAG